MLFEGANTIPEERISRQTPLRATILADSHSSKLCGLDAVTYSDHVLQKEESLLKIMLRLCVLS